MNLLVRTTREPTMMREAMAEAVYRIDPDQPVARGTTLEAVRRESISAPRITTMLLAMFAALALTVTASGLTGVLALSVSQRRHELGIRLAFGATRARLLTMVLGRGMGLVLVGFAVGTIGALGLTGLMTSLLFEVEPTDPLTYIGVTALLLVVAALACLVPARSASTIDPAIALRTD